MAALLLSVPSPSTQSKRDRDNAGTVRGVCRRLKLSNEETDHITWLVTNLHALDDAPSLPLSQLKRLLVHEQVTDLLTLARRTALAEQRDTAGLDFAAAYLANTPKEVLNPSELLNGSDLQKLGLSPSPQFKEILTAIRDAQLNELIATADEARALAVTMLK